MAPIPASLLALFGPIRDLLLDSTVRRVLIDGPRRIYVQRSGPPRPIALDWPAEGLEEALAGLARRAGKPFDAESPCLEAVLRDGTRFLALRAPVVQGGPVLAITRPTPSRGGDGLLDAHEAVAETLALTMAAGLNVGVVGAPGPARDGLMQRLVAELPAAARVVVIDDDEVLDLGPRPVVRLTPRRADGEGRRAVSVGDLLYSAGRLEPDLVVVSQLRLHDGWDAVSLLAGRMCPVLIALAGRDPADGLAWLAGFAAAGGPAGRDRAVPAMVGAGLDVVVTVDGGLAPRLLRVDRVVPSPLGPALEPLHLAQPNGTLTTEPAHGRFAVQWSRASVNAQVDESEGEMAPDASMAGAIRDALAAVVSSDPASSPPGARPLLGADSAMLSAARIELPDMPTMGRRAFPTVPTLSDIGDVIRDEDSLDIAVDVPPVPATELERTQALDAPSPEALAALNVPDPELDEATSAERAPPGDPLRRLLASLEGQSGNGNTTGEIELALDGMEEDEEEGDEETVVQRPATTHRTFSEILRSLGRRVPTPGEVTTEKPPTRTRRSRTTRVRDED